MWDGVGSARCIPSRRTCPGTGTETSAQRPYPPARPRGSRAPSARPTARLTRGQAQGQYLARSLSFRGASFEVVREELAPEFVAMYDGAVALWRRIVAAVYNGRASSEPRRIKSHRWGAHMRFWAQVGRPAAGCERVEVERARAREWEREWKGGRRGAKAEGCPIGLDGGGFLRWGPRGVVTVRRLGRRSLSDALGGVFWWPSGGSGL